MHFFFPNVGFETQQKKYFTEEKMCLITESSVCATFCRIHGFLPDLQQLCRSGGADGPSSGLLGGARREEERRGEAGLLHQKHAQVQFPLAAGQPAATRGCRAQPSAHHVHDGGDQGEE